MEFVHRADFSMSACPGRLRGHSSSSVSLRQTATIKSSFCIIPRLVLRSTELRVQENRSSVSFATSEAQGIVTDIVGGQEGLEHAEEFERARSTQGERVGRSVVPFVPFAKVHLDLVEGSDPRLYLISQRVHSAFGVRSKGEHPLRITVVDVQESAFEIAADLL